MMATFTPPTDDLLNLSDFSVEYPWSQEKRIAYRFLRHYAPLPRGRNVFKLDDGSYVENEPADMSTVAVTYYGGHDYEVDAAEVASLTAAGYGDYIS
jgi:hypothetical protein